MKQSICNCALVLAKWLIVTSVTARAAITVGHVDNFQDGTTQVWRVGQLSQYPENAANAGPQGAGDHALHTTNAQSGSKFRLIVLNEDTQAFPGAANWEGNWTAAGVTQVSMDIRNPGTVAGATALTMRLGIAGPGGAGAFGDVYITKGIVVPTDNQWHAVTFEVLPADFKAAGSGTDVIAALADVTQFRIFNSPAEEFLGSDAPNSFYLDNIRAIGTPARLAGDYNGNGTVDAADYVLWRATLGEQVTPGTAADGTGPMGQPDGVVNALDYEFWRTRFGNAGPAAIDGLEVLAVPEPTCSLLLVGLIVPVSLSFRRF
jgi:hypothetical protein